MLIEIYDPAMCCSSGVCGPSVDPALVKLLDDINWLRDNGVRIRRYNLAQNPDSFVENETVTEELKKDPDCLPLMLADGAVVSKGTYLSRAELAELAGLEAPADDAGGGCCPGGCCG